MKTSFIRLGSILILIAILVLPYSNCGGPTDQGLFPSGDINCVDPTNPQTCKGDPTKVRFGQLPTSLLVSGGSGIISFQGGCASGGFIKALVFVEVLFTQSGQLVNRMLDPFRCNNGVFVARLEVPNGIAWNNYELVARLTLKVYESEDSTIDTPINPPVVANIPLVK